MPNAMIQSPAPATGVGFRAFAELMPDAVLLTDDRGIIRLANTECERLFGYGVQELLGKPIEILVPERLRNKHAHQRTSYEEAPHRRRMRSGLDLLARRKDGSEFPAEISLNPIVLDTGPMVCAVVRDMSEAKELLEKARLTAEKLSNSNAELEQFASIAAHDLQEPLRTIAGAAHMLAHESFAISGMEARELTESMLQGARRMQSLINALREYARAGMPREQLQMVELGDALKQARENLKALIEASGARITNDPLPKVYGDEVRLSQLFQNLLGNAIKFRSSATPSIHVSSRPSGNEWEITVQDNGTGIDPRHFQRLFVIFQRFHDREKFPGMGIGLAICKKIVEQHGGAIWAESTTGKGSTFHFTLPKRTPVKLTTTSRVRPVKQNGHRSHHARA